MKYIIVNEGAICWEHSTLILLPYFGDKDRFVKMYYSMGQQG
jgi:hypothetical protein